MINATPTDVVEKENQVTVFAVHAEKSWIKIHTATNGYPIIRKKHFTKLSVVSAQSEATQLCFFLEFIRKFVYVARPHYYKHFPDFDIFFHEFFRFKNT